MNIAVGDVDADGDVDIAIAVGLYSTNAFFTFEHCPDAVRLGSSQACLSKPNHANRPKNTDQANACPANLIGSGQIDLCAPCSAGYERAFGNLDCSPCVPGKATYGSGVECKPCAPGFQARSNGTIACTPCPAGTYASTVGTAECQLAPIGHYASLGAIEPKKCGVGRYGNTIGRTDDQCNGACAEGHYVCGLRSDALRHCMQCLHARCPPAFKRLARVPLICPFFLGRLRSFAVRPRDHGAQPTCMRSWVLS